MSAPGHRTYPTHSEFISCNHQAGSSRGSGQIGQITQASQIKRSGINPPFTRGTACPGLHVPPTFGFVWGCFGAAKAASSHMLRKHLQLFPPQPNRQLVAALMPLKAEQRLSSPAPPSSRAYLINPTGKLPFSPTVWHSRHSSLAPLPLPAHSLMFGLQLGRQHKSSSVRSRSEPVSPPWELAQVERLLRVLERTESPQPSLLQTIKNQVERTDVRKHVAPCQGEALGALGFAGWS